MRGVIVSETDINMALLKASKIMTHRHVTDKETVKS